MRILELTAPPIAAHKLTLSRFVLVLLVSLLFTIPEISAIAEIPPPSAASPPNVSKTAATVALPVQSAISPPSVMQKLYQVIHIPQRIELGSAEAITIDPVHKRLIAAEEQGWISVYDLGTMTRVAAVEHQFHTPGWFRHAGDIVYDSRRNRIFIETLGADLKADGSVGVYDGDTLAYVATLRKPGTDPLDNLGYFALDSKSDRLIVGDRRGGAEFFDAGTLKYISSLDLHSLTNPDLPMGFLGFDPIHRYLLKMGQDDPKQNTIPPRECIDVFNADTGAHIRVAGSCDPVNPPSQFAFGAMVSLAVDARTGLVIVVENDLVPGGCPIVRLRIVNSATLADVASVDSSVDRNMFLPAHLAVNDGLAYILFEDVATSGKSYLERYDLTQLARR